MLAYTVMEHVTLNVVIYSLKVMMVEVLMRL